MLLISGLVGLIMKAINYVSSQTQGPLCFQSELVTHQLPIFLAIDKGLQWEFCELRLAVTLEMAPSVEGASLASHQALGLTRPLT